MNIGLEIRKRQLEDLITLNSVNYLCHITPILNLTTIAQYGIYSRRHLEQSRIKFFHTDAGRYDRRENFISCTFHRPHYGFTALKRRLFSTDSDNGIGILIINRNILLNAPEVLFFNELASKKEYAKLPNPIFYRPAPLISFFGNQADMGADEIMIRDWIPPCYIQAVIIPENKKDSFLKLRQSNFYLSFIPWYINSKMFRKWKEYSYWYEGIEFL